VYVTLKFTILLTVMFRYNSFHTECIPEKNWVLEENKNLSYPVRVCDVREKIVDNSNKDNILPTI